MTFQPVIERELRVAARRSGVYRSRVLVPALLMLILFLQWVFAPFGFSQALAGRMLYNLLSWLALGICVLEGVRQTADCISSEKREGTLGLLFLTDLNGADVVLGKLAAASLASAHGLLAMTPILACAFILGGVTAGEIFRVTLALASLLFSLAMGLWVSSRSRSAGRAMGGTFCLLMIVLSAPFANSHAAFLSPAEAFFAAAAGNFDTHPMAYWGSLAFAQILVVVLLARAAANTHLFREDEPVKLSSLPSASSANAPTTWSGRAASLDVTPVLWLAGRNAAAGWLVWGLVFLAVMAAGGFLLVTLARIGPFQIGFDFAMVFGLVLAVHLILKVLLAEQACRCLAEARRNATLELLLCTPLKVENILRGQVLALQRRFLAPFLLLLLLEMTGVYMLVYAISGTHAPGSPAYHDYFGIVMAVEIPFTIFFLLDLNSVAWTGFWFGLCSKNESMATFKTAFYIIIVPLALPVLYCVGPVLFVAWPIAAYYWARIQLQEHFRLLAGLRLSSGGNLTSWLPFHVPELPPEPHID